jgi:membrane-associated protein
MFGITALSPENLSALGPIALLIVFAAIFAETGLLVGFFLPGDSLLFPVGLMVASHAIDFPIWFVCLVVSIAAFAGDQTGYFIGRKAGPAIFNKPDSKFFSQKNVSRTNSFFERYGSRAIILAHFVPVMRTFIPVAAGIGQMPHRRFTMLNIIGVIGWATGLTLLGFFLGRVDFVAKHVEYFTLGFVIISTIPILIEVVKARREHR